MTLDVGHGWVIAGAVFSALLVIIALAFLVSEFIRFRRRKTPGYTGFISMRSTARRMTGSLVLIALALMVFLAMCVVDLSKRPASFAGYWSVCAILAFALFVMGLLDFREVRGHRAAHELKLLWRMTRGMPKNKD